MDDSKDKHRQRPQIPVHSNRRTNFVRMSEMHGDKLPELRNVEKPEFSNRTRHFNGLVKTHMWKDVHLMYKEHIIAMNKVKRGQDHVFKMLCKVTRAKRVVQREEYVRRQADARAKFTSQRMLLFIRKVVEKFKENVKKKKTLRAEEEKRIMLEDSTSKQDQVVTDGGKITLKSTDIAAMDKLKYKLKNVESDMKRIDDSTSNASQYSNKNTDKHETKSHSAEGKTKRKPLYTVQTAENRARHGTSILDTEHSTSLHNADENSAELQMGRLPTKAVEVSKDSGHHVQLKRVGSDQTDFFKNCKRKGSAKTMDSVSSNAETTTTDSRQVSFAIENDQSSKDSDTDDSPSPPPRMNRGRRKSLFEPVDPEDDEYRDYGWFTFGNPVKEKKAKSADTDSFPHSRASSESRASRVSRTSRVTTEKQRSVMFEDEAQCSGATEILDIAKENEAPYSLPPVRTRKVATVGDPPLNLLLENNTETRKVSISNRSDVNEVGTSTSKHKQSYNEYDDKRASNLETAKQDPRLIKRKVDFESNDNVEHINQNGNDFKIWYPVSSKERKTYFVEPLKNSKKKSSLEVTDLKSAPDKSVEESTMKAEVKRKETHKDVKARQTRFLEDEMSANMAWVLKQEDKNRNSRQARILDKEDVRRYKFVSHNKLVSELVHKDETKFIPPSHKELHLQRKLERKNEDDILKQRIKIAHFHKTITVGFELDKAPTRTSDSLSATSRSLHSVTPNVQEFSKPTSLTFDIFQDQGLRLGQKEDSMTRIRYIRNDKVTSPRRRGGRRISMWNLQDTSKLKITKNYA